MCDGTHVTKEVPDTSEVTAASKSLLSGLALHLSSCRTRWLVWNVGVLKPRWLCLGVRAPGGGKELGLE